MKMTMRTASNWLNHNGPLFFMGSIFILMLVLSIKFGYSLIQNAVAAKPSPIVEIAKIEEPEIDPILNEESIFVDKALLRSFIEDQNYKVFPALAEIIIDAIFVASKKYDIPPVVLFSLVKVESDFNYSAVSKTGAIGLTQISNVWLDPQNEHSIIKNGIVKKKKDLYDPTKNIMAGAFVLKHYIVEGEGKGVSNPIRYGVTRYLGGYKNDHYQNLITAIGEFYVHTLIAKKAKEGTNQS